MMVRSIMEGEKTQTRRICKHQFWTHSELVDFNENQIHSKIDRNVSCPFGAPGDLLWVRETWCDMQTASKEEDNGIRYKASIGKNNFTWKPSIHMPKKAARIWLKIVDVRVERLAGISHKDAIAEGIKVRISGVKPHDLYYQVPGVPNLFPRAMQAFEWLWKNINGIDSWEQNPWVWVIEFEVLSVNGRPDLKAE